MTFVVAATVEAASRLGSLARPLSHQKEGLRWSSSACLPPATSCSRPCGTAVAPGGTVLSHPALARLGLKNGSLECCSLLHCSCGRSLWILTDMLGFSTSLAIDSTSNLLCVVVWS